MEGLVDSAVFVVREEEEAEAEGRADTRASAAAGSWGVLGSDR